jgi:thymidylate synthase
MEEYQTAIKHILDHGRIKKDRTGVGTKSVFGYMMRFDLIRTVLPRINKV